MMLSYHDGEGVFSQVLTCLLDITTHLSYLRWSLTALAALTARRARLAALVSTLVVYPSPARTPTTFTAHLSSN